MSALLEAPPLSAPTRRAGKHKIGEIVALDLDRVRTKTNYRQIDRQSDDYIRFKADIEKNGQEVPASCYWDETDKIYIVAEGNKRLAVCQDLGRQLKAYIWDEEPTELELLDFQLRMNTKRSDGNMLEKARAYARSKELHGFKTNRELAEHFSEHEATISKLLAILELPLEGQLKIAGGASMEATLKLYSPKPRRVKGHGKRRSLSLGGGKTVLLTARKPVEDALAIEMLKAALNIFAASQAIESEADLRIAAGT